MHHMAYRPSHADSLAIGRVSSSQVRTERRARKAHRSSASDSWQVNVQQLITTLRFGIGRVFIRSKRTRCPNDECYCLQRYFIEFWKSNDGRMRLQILYVTGICSLLEDGFIYNRDSDFSCPFSPLNCYVYYIVADFYQPLRTSGHTSVLVENQLYVWAGRRDNLPQVHQSLEKLRATSYVDVFQCRLGM